MDPFGPFNPFGPPPLTPLYRSECGSGGSGGPVNPHLGPSGWGNGGAGLTPGYDIGRPLNHYEEARHFTPTPLPPAPIKHVVLPKLEPEPLFDPYWIENLLPDCGDDFCHLDDYPCIIEKTPIIIEIESPQLIDFTERIAQVPKPTHHLDLLKF
jgi:hypothetical protein